MRVVGVIVGLGEVEERVGVDAVDTGVRLECECQMRLVLVGVAHEDVLSL
jgi:hypothetical protein